MALSLWLTPPGASHARLAHLIEELARRFGTVAFEPHVTLLGGIEAREEALLSGARSLASRLRPLELRLGAAGTGVDFYHCVFVEVAATPGLRQANALARAAFARARDEPFRPHLSLVYGRLDEGQKEAARAAAGDPGCSFTADALQVMDTSGNVPGWRRLSTCRFGPSSS